MNRGRAGYSPMDPTPPPYTVDLLCADHELGREPIHRTRLHPRTEPGGLAQRGLAGVCTGPECVAAMSGQATPMVDDVPRPPERGTRPAAGAQQPPLHGAGLPTVTHVRTVTHVLVGCSRS